ncbi:MAG: hypothetical protein ACI89L_002137 [Phycisphaerales bacterium]|jgi:hypothetical protein
MRSWIAAGVLGLATSLASAGDGLRVAEWNVTYYNGSNSVDIQNGTYGVFEGRSLSPDVILLAEIVNITALNLLVSHLNNAPGSPSDWAAGPFYSASTSGGINTAFVYRTGKVDFLGATLVKAGTSGENPRNVVRYDVRLDGYTSEDATFSFYPTHMKAGSGSTDQSRRLIEAQAVTTNAATLPAGRNFAIGGDFNIQSSNQSAFAHLVGSPYNTGLFTDPIRTPGTWNNSSTYRMLHTQDPSGAGGMDDRHDMILISQSFGDGVGSEYVGNFDTAWNLTTWNDPNHSYRVWGNDGTSFNVTMTTTGNTNVGASIAQSIKVLAGSGGHCPSFFDTAVPAVITADTALIDFGDINVGDTPAMNISVGSGGNTALWGALIGDSDYQFGDDLFLTEPVGSFQDAAGGGLNLHSITFTNSGSPGVVNGTLQIVSNDTQTPILSVPYTANVIEEVCGADITGDGVIDNGDIGAFVTLFLAGDPAADMTGDGVIDNGDIGAFVTAFLAGC